MREPCGGPLTAWDFPAVVQGYRWAEAGSMIEGWRPKPECGLVFRVSEVHVILFLPENMRDQNSSNSTPVSKQCGEYYGPSAPYIFAFCMINLFI